MLKSAVILSMIFVALGLTGCGAIAMMTDETATPTPRWLQPSAFEVVCSGQGIAAATPFDPDDGVNTLLIFIRAGEDEPYVERHSFSSSAPSFPFKKWLPAIAENETTELVVCLTVTEREFVERCEYVSERNNIQESFYLDTQNATYEAVLLEALTGRTVDNATLYGPSEGCPLLGLFKPGDVSRIFDGEPVTDLIEFLKPYEPAMKP